MRTIVTLVVGSAAALLSGRIANAYPMILEIPEESERVCVSEMVRTGMDLISYFLT